MKRKKKKVVRRIKFCEAYYLIWSVRPEISKWRFRQDIRDGIVNVIRRETKKRDGWMFFEPDQIERYIKTL